MPVSVFSQARTANGLIVRNQTGCVQYYQVFFCDKVCQCADPDAEPPIEVEYLPLTDIIPLYPGQVVNYSHTSIVAARIPEVYPPGCNVGATVGHPCPFTGFLFSHTYIAKLTCGTPCQVGNPNTTATWHPAMTCGQPAELRFTSP
ncbi:MAG: hypothetical protein AB7D46_07770 [Flavobacteriaceae bacterium]